MIQFRRRTVVMTAIAFAVVAAIAVTALVRTADAGGNGFSDTPPWIAAHAAWLSDNGIAGGFPDGTFRPNNNITRGQAAFWFGNYNDSIERVVGTISPPANSAFLIGLECPAGKRAIAGGGTHDQDNMFMTDSYVDPIAPTIWAVRWETENDAVVSPAIAMYALCAPEILGAAESLGAAEGLHAAERPLLAAPTIDEP